VVEENVARAGKSHYYRNVIVFEKLRFQTVFRPHQNHGLKRIADPFKFLRFEERFQKLRFRDGFNSVDGRPNRGIKAAFLYSENLRFQISSP